MRRALLLVACLCVGCAGGNASPAATPSSTPAPTPAPAPAEAELETPADPAADSPGEETPTDAAPRDISYVMRSDGLEIQILGARFRPRVKPVRVGGGWGVQVELLAQTSDAVVSLLSPKHGPLAFAGSVSKGGETRSFGDQRQGDGEEFLTPGEPLKFERRWPAKAGEKPVMPGETLKLEVGLWGIGPDSDTRRPVNKFFRIDMTVARHTPQPVIMPPENVK